MNSRALKKSALSLAMGVCLATMVPMAVAANTDGALAGQAEAGAQVTVTNPETGFTRTVTASADGSYRFPFLPVGTYTLQATRNGAPVGEPRTVNVSLGTTTTVDVGTTTLDTVTVVGSGISTPVDVSSTESATNISREELQLLPVERDAQAVALLAPGLVKGEFGGLSFGGSSVAENAVYINGLNVTDFYNRVGFSSVPFAFYEEFQVKTGGYSVEFGRTTGGVINAVTRSGTNEFHAGAELVWEPSFLQAEAKNHYNPNGEPRYYASEDEYDRRNMNVWASGPIIRDKLFFFGIYEDRDYRPQNTDSPGTNFFKGRSDDAFWGGKIDWQINDNHLLELLAFSDENEQVTNIYDFDSETGEVGGYENTRFVDSGGRNWAATYTGYLTDTFSVKAMYGENERQSSGVSLNDIDCTRYRDRRDDIGQGDVGCTTSGSVTERLDTREAARLDFEWALGDHLLRFGLDREVNTSEHEQFYPGPERLVYEIFSAEPGDQLANGGVVPAGATAYVRTRANEVDGEFESVNTAWYLEDNWSVTDNLVLNLGIRNEGFDNKDSDGRSYIKIDDMWAPRFGFSWDVNGDGRSKFFGNLGRYFLPVANVINIKQAGGFLDRRTFYVFEGFEEFTYNGESYLRPILGDQIGPVDQSQGDGTVGDLRAEVDADMDPVYQDELILGYQSMIDERWSWGVRGIYRRLTNAIDDMAISSTGAICDGEPVDGGFVMGNPGEELTIYTDTDCDGENDSFVTIDTSRAGFALYDDDGNFIGERGFEKPRRSYRALEFVIDRAWDDKWAFNASYTLAYSRGNAEGPVNSDTDFSDTGRTENFDDPFVNLGGYGDLPNDRRHQFKFRGAYALSENWQVGATLNAQSGRPINAFGVSSPFYDDVYHTYYICVQNCDSDVLSERVFEYRPRGSGGRLPWTFDLGANLTWKKSFGETDLRVKFAVYNLLDMQRVTEVDDELQTRLSNQLNPEYGRGTSYQSPRYGQLTVSLDF